MITFTILAGVYNKRRWDVDLLIAVLLKKEKNTVKVK